MHKILMFGASGFIGLNIVDHFTKNNDFELVKPSLEECDLFNRDQTAEFIKSTAPDFVFNAAFIGVNSSIEFSKDYLLNNIVMLTNLITGCRGVPSIKKFLHIGSSLEYGDSDKPITEQTSLNPQNMYAVIKAMTTTLGVTLAKEYSVPLTVIRPFNLYGPHDNKSVIHYIIKSVLTSADFTVTKGEQTRDYLYIRDFAKIVEECFRRYERIPNYEEINVASGSSVQLSEMFKTIYEIAGFTKQPKYREYSPNETWKQEADIGKLQSLIVVSTSTPLHKGMKETIEWVNDDLKHY